jgi:hypothetical protein
MAHPYIPGPVFMFPLVKEEVLVYPKKVAEAPQGGVRVKLGVTESVGVLEGKGVGEMVTVLVTVRVGVRVTVIV